MLRYHKQSTGTGSNWLDWKLFCLSKDFLYNPCCCLPVFWCWVQKLTSLFTQRSKFGFQKLSDLAHLLASVTTELRNSTLPPCRLVACSTSHQSFVKTTFCTQNCEGAQHLCTPTSLASVQQQSCSIHSEKHSALQSMCAHPCFVLGINQQNDLLQRRLLGCTTRKRHSASS